MARLRRFHARLARATFAFTMHPLKARFPVLDAVGVAIAVAYALPSLGYVYGRDQAAFHYIGRGLRGGELPYVAAADNKPPAIFAVYALASLVPGMWAIRALEIVVLIGCGALIARVIRDGGARRDGDLATGTLLAIGVHYTCFDYWSTAQAELWEATSLFAAWVVVRGTAPLARRALAAGALVGIACIFKFTAVMVGAGVVVLLVHRSFREHEAHAALRAFALFCAGGAAVCAVVLAPYVLSGTTRILWDAIVGFNANYVKNTALRGPWDYYFTTQGLPYWPIASSAIIYLAVRRTGQERRLALGILALLLLSFGSVMWQGKWFAYHYGALTPFLAAAIAFSASRLVPNPRWRVLSTVGLVVFGLVAGPPFSGGLHYRRHVARWIDYSRGALPRDSYLASFGGPNGYSFVGSVLIGTRLREAASPGDTLCVDAFEPAIYEAAGMRCTSRFFATQLLRDPSNATYRNGAWAAEYEASLREKPPTFFVGLEGDATTKELTSHGYRVMSQIGAWRLLRRDAPPR